MCVCAYARTHANTRVIYRERTRLQSLTARKRALGCVSFNTTEKQNTPKPSMQQSGFNTCSPEPSAPAAEPNTLSSRALVSPPLGHSSPAAPVSGSLPTQPSGLLRVPGRYQGIVLIVFHGHGFPIIVKYCFPAGPYYQLVWLRIKCCRHF